MSVPLGAATPQESPIAQCEKVVCTPSKLAWLGHDKHMVVTSQLSARRI